jgi:uncharacterized glyoxalase superfamily protein PhnB
MSATTANAMFAYYVPDPGVAADWYRDHFGFEILGDHRTDAERRWVTASPPGATWLINFSDVNVHGEGELADRFRSELGFAPHFMLIVDDVDVFVARAAGTGVEVVEPPSAGPFGQFAALKDLHGDVITVATTAGWAFFRR